MDEEAYLVEGIIEDFNSLNEEISRELSGEGFTRILGIMEMEGYSPQIELIRNRIRILVEHLQGKLEALRTSVDTHREMEADEGITKEIMSIKSLLGQLVAVWDRLENLVAIIEQKQAAQAGKVHQAITRLKGWIATLASWIKRISGQLWSLLCKLLTPKEWKLGGKIGTGPFGLADVTVEITFGN